MELVIYLDIFFLVNMGMNWFMLGILNKLIKEKTSLIRIILAAVFGACGGCVLMILPIKSAILAFLFQYIGINYIMMQIMYRKCSKGRIGRYMLFFYITAFIMGGALETLSGLLSSGKILGASNAGMGILWFGFLLEGSKQKIGVMGLLTAGLFMYGILRLCLWRWGSNISKSKMIYPVEICYQNKKVSGFGLYDTGNHLKEPISGKPVIIAEYDFIQVLFTKEVKQTLEIFPNYTKDSGSSVMLRWIPYHSLGKQDGVLPGIEIDRIGIGEAENRRWYDKIYLAVYKGKISADSSYQLILHNECMLYNQNKSTKKSKNIVGGYVCY